MCSVLFVFSGYVVRHRCRVPGCDTEEDTEYSQPWLNWTTPATEEGVSGGGVVLRRQQM